MGPFEGVDDWLATRVGQPIPLPDGFVPRGGFGDPAYMIRLVVPKEAVSLGSISIALTYHGDEAGETRRAVRLKRGWFDRSILYVSGYCELRREPRMFRGDRMLEIIDWRTGEVHSDPGPFFAEFGLTERPLLSFDVFRRIRHAAVILMALASADGEVHADEIEAVLRFADEIAFDAGIELATSDLKIIRRAAQLMRPDADDVAEAILAIRGDRSVHRPLQRAMRTLIAADDRISPEEKRLVEICIASLQV